MGRYQGKLIKKLLQACAHRSTNLLIWLTTRQHYSCATYIKAVKNLKCIHNNGSVVCYSIGRIIVGGVRDKINIQNGLCAKENICFSEHCLCCLLTNHCYINMDVCKRNCGDLPSSSSEDMLAAVTLAPLPAYLNLVVP